MSIPTPTLLSTPAPTLESALLAAGFRPGAPAHLAEAVRLDARCYRRYALPCHRGRGLFRPYHRGSAYRALVVCPTCGRAEEV